MTDSTGSDTVFVIRIPSGTGEHGERGKSSHPESQGERREPSNIEVRLDKSPAIEEVSNMEVRLDKSPAIEEAYELLVLNADWSSESKSYFGFWGGKDGSEDTTEETINQ